MGQELSCPCDYPEKYQLVEDKHKPILDITETLLLGKLKEEEIIFEKLSGDWKVVIIKTCDLIRFFNSKKLRLIYNTQDVFYYYSTVFITNFLSNDLSFIIFKHVKGEEDKSSTYTDNRKSFKRKSISLEDKSIFKVENINLVSNDLNKIKQHILADLNTNLSKDYIFCGITADSDDIVSPKWSSKLLDSLVHTKSARNLKSLRSFQLVYKRVFMTSLLKCSYAVEIFEGELNEKSIKNIINSDKYSNMLLKAIMLDIPEENRTIYYFVFCKNESTAIYKVQYTVLKMDKGKDKDLLFAEDITRKLEFLQNKFILTCVVTDYLRQRCYFILVDVEFDFEMDDSQEYIITPDEKN